jgi:Ser/Thr protein kinase RdoA (MazF antagonist)
MPGVTSDHLRILRAAARGVLENEHGLENARLTLLRNGRNIVFRVDSAGGERFVLRIHNHDRLTDAMVRTQMRWLQAMGRDANLTVPVPVGAWHIHVEDLTFRNVLLRWVQGRRVRAGASFIRPQTLRAVGRTTAMLHAHAARSERPAPGDCRQLDAEHFFGAQTCAGRRGSEILTDREHDVVRRGADKIRDAMRRLRDRSDQFGLIHGDLEPANWVFFRGEARPIDFDEFGAGFFGFDLMQVIWTHAMWPDYAAFREALLDGYESLRPIPSDARQHLDLFQAVTFIEWLNKGLSTDPEPHAEFMRWRAPTIARIASLCDV